MNLIAKKKKSASPLRPEKCETTVMPDHLAVLNFNLAPDNYMNI